MLSISNMTSEQAAHYHKQDQNYYSQNGEIGQWQGKAAEALGLNGAIDHAQFERLCHGINPNSDEVLVNTSKRAGTDLTFSAPKSVSMIMELSSKDDELLIRQAHDLAVSKAIEHIEANYSQTREQFNGFRETINTGNLCVAKFQHDTSRELDPQLHTHAFVLNMTQKENGEWRALHNDELFKNKLYLGQVYRNELALQLKELGYSIEVTNAKQGLFEIKGVSKELMDSFSQRAKQVESKLEELKKEYPNAKEGDLIQMAKLDSRKAKDKTVDRTVIRADNINKAKEIVNIEEMLLNVKNQSQEHTVLSSKEILNQAKTILTDKESVFTKEELLKESMKLSLGTYNKDDFEEAIKVDSELVNFEKNIYSTKEMIEIEKQIVSKINEKKSSLKEIAVFEKSNEFVKDSTMTNGQKEAFNHILNSQDLVSVIQGDAGVGKTYMLNAVNEYINQLQDENKPELVGLSFTGKAASEIEKEAGIISSTLHSFLNQKEFKDNQVYLVDEAGMIGSKQMHKLMEKAIETNSRIVLIGDTKQFQTISAGAIFEQLQIKGIVKAVNMSESMRAKTEVMKDLYENVKSKNFEKVFQMLNQNNQIEEIDHENKYTKIINEYLKNSTESLLIVSKNSDRNELNQGIRKKLNLSKGKFITINETVGLTDVEKHFHNYYEVGQIITIEKAMQGFRPGQSFKIVKKDEVKNTILVADKENKFKTIDLSKNGDKIQNYQEVKKEFAKGELITFTKNNKQLGLLNGEVAVVKSIKNDLMTVEKNNKEVEIDLKKYNNIDYGYALTTYKSQGQTTKKVIALTDAEMTNLNSFYVSVTRAKEDVKIFTNNIEKFKENSMSAQTKSSTLDYEISEMKKLLHANIIANESGQVDAWSIGRMDKLNRFTGILHDQTGKSRESSATLYVLKDKVVTLEEFENEEKLFDYQTKIRDFFEIEEEKKYSSMLQLNYIKEEYHLKNAGLKHIQNQNNFLHIPPIKIGATQYLGHKNVKTLDKNIFSIAKEYILEAVLEATDKFRDKLAQALKSNKSLAAEAVAKEKQEFLLRKLQENEKALNEKKSHEMREDYHQMQIKSIVDEYDLNKIESSLVAEMIDLDGLFKTDDPSVRWGDETKKEIKTQAETIRTLIESNAVRDEKRDALRTLASSLTRHGIYMYPSIDTIINVENERVQNLQIGQVDEKTNKFSGLIVENSKLHYIKNGKEVFSENGLNFELKVFDNIAYLDSDNNVKLYDFVLAGDEFKNGNYQGKLYGHNDNLKVYNMKDFQHQNQNETANEQKEKSFVENFQNAHKLFEKFQDVKEFIDPNSNIDKLLKNEESLDLIKEMSQEHGLSNINEQAVERFKNLAENVLKEVTKNPTLDFDVVMKETVRLCGKLFENQIDRTRAQENEM